MPSADQVAAALLVVSALLFAAPLYADALVDDGPDRSSQVVGARPLGETHDGYPLDRTKDLVDTWGPAYVLDLQRYDALSARGGTDHLDCNRAVNDTVDLLRRAADEGSAETGDDAVGADLRCMAERHDYYRPPDDEQRGYRSFSVSTDGGTTRVETRAVNDSELATALRSNELTRYADLNATERRTVDRILDNSSEGYGDYRPRSDDPILDRTPLLLQKGDTTYVVETVGHADDFGAAVLFLVLGLWAAGGVSLLGALAAGGYALYARSRDG